jgi:hypothetical protein
MLAPCVHASTGSGANLTPQRQRPAARTRRVHRNVWLEQGCQPNCTICATFHWRAQRAESCEVRLAPPAQKSSGFGPSRSLLRTLRRPWLAGEARPAAPRCVRRCTPAASGARGVWEALERHARNVILRRADGGGSYVREYPNGSTHRFPAHYHRHSAHLKPPPSHLF